MDKFKIGVAFVAAAALMVGCFGCNGSEAPASTEGTTGTAASTTGSAPAGPVSGTMAIDGSGTVYPISAGLTEIFNEKNPDAKITVGKAGTGGGMKIFEKGETDISDASRPIKADEIDALGKAGIEFIELPISYDGICIVVNSKNDFVKDISKDQLHKIWDKTQQGVKTKWSDINPAWPAREIKLYGPTSAHGTYEYFNEEVNGKGDNVRQDYSQQAEYEGLIKGVESEPDALGYVGYAYYDGAKDRLKAVPVTTDKGTVAASFDTIADGSYAFSRPLMMYVKKSSYESNPVTKAFLEMLYSPAGQDVIKQVGYVPLPADLLQMSHDRLTNGVTGSVLSSAPQGTPLKDLLTAK